MLENLFHLSRTNLELKSRPVERHFMIDKLGKHRANIVLGPRGVGKTTTLIQYLLQQVQGDSQSTEILYLPCDHILMEGVSLYHTVDHFRKMGGRIVALDEIHKYSGWSKELKSLYDTFPDLIILASGSSALEIHKGSHDLSRRVIIHKMPGLSFREYLQLNCGVELPHYNLDMLLHNHENISKNIIQKIPETHGKILPLFSRYLQSGFFPYFLDLNDKHSYWITLEQNIVFTIESDLVAVYPHLTGGTLKKLKQLLSFISQSVPFTPSWTKIKTIVAVKDDRTLKTYFKYLEDAGLIRMVSKYSSALLKLRSPEKIYLHNPNQIYALSTGLSNKGSIRETFFICMFDMGHNIGLPANGDFMVDGKYCFEVGGHKKGFKQIEGLDNAYVVSDDIEHGFGQRVPLWIFGFLY
jgi:uncharacterized protein